jgi:signal transduction histidine kinase
MTWDNDQWLSADRRRDLLIAANRADLQHQFLRGLSHALGGPMQSLALSLPEYSGSTGVSSEDVRFILDVAGASLTSLGQILDTSAEFSRLAIADEAEPVRVEDLFANLDRFQRFFRTLARAELVREAGPGLPPLRGSPSAMSHALLAVVLNAAEAGGGARRVLVRAEFDPDGLRIVVRDDGPGIPAVDRERVFAPFVTGKGAEHRGIGLTVASLLMGEQEGRISVDDPDEGWPGACVVLTAPLWG